MAGLWKAKRGDSAPMFRAQCLDGTTPVNLTSATGVRFLMRNQAGAVVINAAMVVEDQTANTGWVHYAWAPTDLAVAGYYQAEVEVTWGDDRRQTFPPEDTVSILVSADVA